MRGIRLKPLVAVAAIFIMSSILGYVTARLLFGSVAKADPPKKRVFLIGDSQGWLLMQDLPRLAPKEWDLKGAPVPGSSIISWSREDHAREWSRLRSSRPDTVLVVLGTNDAYMGPRIIKNEPEFLERFLKKLERSSKRIVWAGPPWLENRQQGFREFNAMMRAIPPRIQYLDSSMVQLKFWGDKMHCARPDPDGCEKWARWIIGQTQAHHIR